MSYFDFCHLYYLRNFHVGLIIDYLISMWLYMMVFLFSLLVDIIPFIGPPAWTIMVFFQVKYHLNIWVVLVFGVIGSTIGRYLLTLYLPKLTIRFVNARKNADLQFLGKKMEGNKWQIQLFVFLYTLLPVPSTPLFTAMGMAKVSPIHIIPAFFAGKFISDAMMVYAGKYATENAVEIFHGLLSWKTMAGALGGLFLLFALLFIDWTTLLKQRKLRFKFNIWK